MAEEIVLLAGVNYPEYKKVRGKGDKTEWTLSKTFGPGPWRSLCFTYAGIALKSHKGATVTLFDVFTGRIERLGMGKSGEAISLGGPTNLGALNGANYMRVSPVDGNALYPLTKTAEGESAQVRYFGKASELLRGRVTKGPIPRGPIPEDEIPFPDYAAKFVLPSSIPLEAGISIKTVYDYVSASSNKIVEFHIFSHGWDGGPILVNSLDIRQRLIDRGGRRLLENPSLTLRDPLDRDGRTKDFDKENIKDLPRFKGSFAADAFTVQWGCNSYDLWRVAIREALRKSSGSSSARFKIEYREDMGPYDEVGANFKRIFEGDKASKNLTMDEFAEKVQVFAIGETYANVLAKASGHTVIGALPGTSGNYDEKPINSALLMHIPQLRKEDKGGNLRDILLFYKKRLGVKFELSAKLKDDPGDFDREFGRGYASYEP